MACRPGSGRDLAARASALAGEPSLPDRSGLASLVQEATIALASEDGRIRPRDSGGRPGGLVELLPQATVIVPDLHARPSFIASVLNWRPPGIDGKAGDDCLATLLEEGKAALVCLGDVFHSEYGSAPRRWVAAFREYQSRWASRVSMDEEMGLSLTAARIVLEAKKTFPAAFHYLKGNHENIADEEGRGDHSFYKFAAEGEMVASWFRRTYGDALLGAYRQLEYELPLLALGESFVASHGEPSFALTREDIIEYRSRPEVVEGLIWTGNGDAEAGSVARSLEALLGPERAASALWFAGHRPVNGRFSLRAGGKFVQFHDPASRRVVFLSPNRLPDPTRDIFEIPIESMETPGTAQGRD